MPPESAPAAQTLALCTACRRQYDVSGWRTGERLTCACGALVTVEAHRPHVPQPCRCGQCGAALEVGAVRCAYCSATITLEERRLSGVCPGCYARLLSGARFCMGCGLEIAPQALRAVPHSARCPRCSEALRARDLGAFEVVECTSCAGLWLEPGTLDRLCREAEQGGGSWSPEPAGPVGSVDEQPVRYLKCITCGDLMTRKNFGARSGVIVDVCREHGVWLDHRELERVLGFAQAGGLQRARALEVERLERAAERARSRAVPPLGGADPAQVTLGERGRLDLGDVLGWIARRLLA